MARTLVLMLLLLLGSGVVCKYAPSEVEEEEKHNIGLPSTWGEWARGKVSEGAEIKKDFAIDTVADAVDFAVHGKLKAGDVRRNILHPKDAVEKGVRSVVEKISRQGQDDHDDEEL
ncbi:hypothetical protein H6P81_014202 [Aristolochia fimbriata]|uniref:Uncharacterized protein n=1 Tax=Aristolochia fimbriata TaxID=158543 RepID=A0AAV7EID7_ARIFI|nr:hypothetical protein H6P81_014202 [Aristolochia fimbriata]